MKVAQGFFRHVHRQHWGIECYHRALKQLCHAERFFVRWKRAIRNHVFCALCAFMQLEARVCSQLDYLRAMPAKHSTTKPPNMPSSLS